MIRGERCLKTKPLVMLLFIIVIIIIIIIIIIISHTYTRPLKHVFALKQIVVK